VIRSAKEAHPQSRPPKFIPGSPNRKTAVVSTGSFFPSRTQRVSRVLVNPNRGDLILGFHCPKLNSVEWPRDGERQGTVTLPRCSAYRANIDSYGQQNPFPGPVAETKPPTGTEPEYPWGFGANEDYQEASTLSLNMDRTQPPLIHRPVW
jgi:hypothetical protein